LGIAAKVYDYTGFITDDPRIMARLNRGNVARANLAFLAAIRRHVHPARQAVQEMRRLTSLGSSNGLQVLRPTPTRLKGSIQDGMSRDAYHCSPTLVSEWPGLVGFLDVLDLKVSHDSPPRNVGDRI
jgi:hypothetical protein